MSCKNYKKHRLIFYDYVVCSVAKNFPAGIYMFKVNNRNTRTKCEICSKLTPERPGVVIDNFEHISHLVLVLLLILSR